MNFFELVDQLIKNTVRVSVPSFLPELILVGTIVGMLLLRVVSFGRGSDRLMKFIAAWLPFFGALAALIATQPWSVLNGTAINDPNLGHEIFTGMLVYDAFTVFLRSLLLVFVVLFVIFTQLSGIPDREDATDFYALILGSTVGMCLMASANHLLMIFLAVEMASVPSYALAGILKGRRQSSEAAIKYAIYGAGTAGIMLYGISLLAGVLGTCHLPTLAVRLSEMLQAGDVFADRYLVLVLGGLMLMVGLAFKLSAFPFHFWCPDVFEGASAEVNAFLSVASKAAALALLLRVVIGVGFVPPTDREAPREVPATTAQFAKPESNFALATTVPARISTLQMASTKRLLVKSQPPAEAVANRVKLNEALEPVRAFSAWLVAIMAAATCTFGNLAAYAQTNIKRLLAYSTIAHAGYLMMPVAAVITLMGTNAVAAQEAISGMAFYLATYLFMNLGAFAIVAFLRNSMHSEEIADYAGLVRTCPGLVFAFSLILFSLIGIPPLVGFVAKVSIFYPLVESQQYGLLVIGGLNTVISLFYYLRIVKAMTLEPEAEHRLPVHFSMLSLPGLYVTAITAPVFLLFMYNNQLFQWTLVAARSVLL